MVGYSTFCIMGVQVIVFGKVKINIIEAVAKASFNRAIKSCAIDPKADDLTMIRLKDS